MKTAFNRLEFTTLVSVWDTLQQLVCEGRREPSVKLEDLQNVITLTDKWHDVHIRQPESEKP